MVGAALVAAFAVAGCGPKVDAVICKDATKFYNRYEEGIKECSATPGCRVDMDTILRKQREERIMQTRCKNANR